MLSGTWPRGLLPRAHAHRPDGQAPAEVRQAEHSRGGEAVTDEAAYKIEQNEVIPDSAQKENTVTWTPETETTIGRREGVMCVLANENSLSWCRKGWLFDVCLSSGCCHKTLQTGGLIDNRNVLLTVLRLRVQGQGGGRFHVWRDPRPGSQMPIVRWGWGAL